MVETYNEASHCYDVKKSDVVKEPEHYRHGTFEVIDEMLMVFGAPNTYIFCLMNAWKYRSRAPYKGKTEEDMQKANQYMEMAYQIAKSNNIQVPEFIRDVHEHEGK